MNLEDNKRDWSNNISKALTVNFYKDINNNVEIEDYNKTKLKTGVLV